MNEVLCNLFSAAPVVFGILSSIGVAACAFVLWSFLKPIFTYLTGGATAIIVTLATIMFVAGCACYGYSVQPNGAFYFGGIAAAVLGGIHIVIQWIRRLIKWCHNELNNQGGL